MNKPYDIDISVDRVIILFLFGLLLFISPLIYWWVADDAEWYTLYIIWSVLIFFIFIQQRSHSRQ